MIAWTSPRTTQVLHQRRDLARLARVRGVLHQPTGLSGETGPPAFALGRLRDRATRGFGAADPPTPRDFVERAQPVGPKPQGQRRGSWTHVRSVAQIALQMSVQ